MVAPSGSCAGMLSKHYPELFADNTAWKDRSREFSMKVFELVSFLTDVLKVERVEAALEAKITYHDSCAGLRELDIQAQPRKLLKSMAGVTLTEMKNPDVCCGFGGTFAVKFSDISNSIVTEKVENIENAEADLLLAGDLGCLLNMAGKLRRTGAKTEVRHIAEVLAGMTDTPPIGGKA